VAQPLTVDAVVYKSGKAEGNTSTIEKIENTRKGYKAGMQMILQEMKSERSVAVLKSAISGRLITEDRFPSTSAYFGADDTRQDALSKLAETEVFQN
jgi:hypothetical protein